MISFLSNLSPMVYKVLAAVAGVLLLISIYFYWKHEIIMGERERVTQEFQKKISEANISAQNQLIQKNTEIAKKQSDLEKAQKEIISKSKELEDATKSYNILRDQYLSGSKRLSIHASPSSKTDTAEQSTDSPSSGGADKETVYLVPGLSVSILDFARRYQENLRLKNECIDLYNAARESVNNSN